MLKRNIHTGILGNMPVPDIGEADVSRISKKAREYLQAADRQRTLFDQAGFNPSRLRALLLSLDSAVLRLYDLPAGAERTLLDQFKGEQRPGIPFPFTSYYPAEFKAEVPLYAYLSETFQRFLRGESPGLTADQEQRHDELVAKSGAGRLTSVETEELHRLQAEVDGYDYALQATHGTASPGSAKSHRLADAKLKGLDDRLASETLREARGS
jgi:hypothetical protein